MRQLLSRPFRKLLERFFSYGIESTSREKALVMRRARAFSLIGFIVLFFSDVVSSTIHGLPEVAIVSVGMSVVMTGGVAFGVVQNGRWITPVTHLGMGVIPLGVFGLATIERSDADRQSANA